MHRLAIVIPAYKPDFFRAGLASIAAQTDQRFTVYVGNDGGPETFRAICAEFPTLDLAYHRFPENLGGRSLAEHWNRCVRMTREPWVWLFADDDIMEATCVEAFHDALPGIADTEAVIRFNTRDIDANGRVREENPAHPPHESGADFLFSRLRGERRSYVVEYVFRRDAFDAAGGFPDFPVAWCSDDAAWYRFSGAGGIRTLPGPRVHWRASGMNITDANRSHQRQKLEAASAFLDFIDGVVRPSARARIPDARDWDAAAETWILGQLRYLMPMRWSVLRDALRTVRHRWRHPPAAQLALAAWWNMTAALRAARGVIRGRLRSR